MPFLRFTLDSGDDREWGYWVPDWRIPAIGDSLHLWYAEPDADEVDGCIGCRIVEREWCFTEDEDVRDELYYRVVSDETIPEGRVPDSDEWPAATWSQRQAEHEARMRSLKAKLHDGDQWRHELYQNSRDSN